MISVWLGNNTTKRKGKTGEDVTGEESHASGMQQKAWSTHDVFKKVFKDRIQAEVVKSGGTIDKMNFTLYNKAVSTIYKELTAEELEQLQATRKSWIKNGIPDEQKQK